MKEENTKKNGSNGLLGGCMTSLKRSFSNAYIGFVKGSLTHLKKDGEMQVLLSGSDLVCYSVGLPDVIVRATDVVSCELIAEKVKRNWGNNQMKDCNMYAVVLNNGESGTFTIWLDKVTSFLQVIGKL